MVPPPISGIGDEQPPTRDSVTTMRAVMGLIAIITTALFVLPLLRVEHIGDARSAGRVRVVYARAAVRVVAVGDDDERAARA